MQRSAKITTKGQITIPIEVRRLLGVREGDEVTFEASPSGVTVTARRKRVDLTPWKGIYKNRDADALRDTREMRGHDELDEKIFAEWAAENERNA
jgi:antitoxin PrlF